MIAHVSLSLKVLKKFKCSIKIVLGKRKFDWNRRITRKYFCGGSNSTEQSTNSFLETSGPEMSLYVSWNVSWNISWNAVKKLKVIPTQTERKDVIISETLDRWKQTPLKHCEFPISNEWQ